MHIYIEKSCGIIIENQTIKRGFGFLGNLRTASRRGFRAVAGRTLHQSSGASVGNPGAKSVKKKFKDKRFAAGCDREVIRKGAELLGRELTDLFRTVLEAMQSLPDPEELDARNGIKG